MPTVARVALVALELQIMLNRLLLRVPVRAR